MSVLTFFIDLFKDWISLFASPIHNVDMLWILIPVYLGWAFTEFYQEKKGTSYGNAISNGIIVLWVGIDWARTTFNLAKVTTGVSSLLMTKFFISGLMFAYGMLIIVHAINTKSTSFYIGKIRLVTYIIVMFTPVFYDVVPLSFSVLLAIVLFFPLYYLIIEVLDFIVPDPQALREDIGKKDDFTDTSFPEQPYQQQYPPAGQYQRQAYSQYQTPNYQNYNPNNQNYNQNNQNYNQNFQNQNYRYPQTQRKTR